MRMSGKSGGSHKSLSLPISWIPFKTLLSRETMRYLGQPHIMIGPPILHQFLFLVVFGVVLGTRIGALHGYSYISFMFPGLVMMVLMMNSYMNPSWSLFAARHFGWIQPILSSPLSYAQIAAAYIFAGVFRGLLVGIILLAFAWVIPGVAAFHNLFYILAYFLVVSFLAASLGCIIGLLVTKFDHIALTMDFIFFPLVFLGGVFYSLEMIEGIGALEIFVRLNPITYMINGLRYGMIGMAELDVGGGLLMLSVLTLALFALIVKLFHDGYHLRV